MNPAIRPRSPRFLSIREEAQSRGQLSDELQKTLVQCFDQDLLDDIYQTFRPSRRTPGVQAREKGLGDLADKILASEMGDVTLQAAADALITEDLPTREAVLEGVLHILTEGFAADPILRSKTRSSLNNGILTAVVIAPKARGAARLQDYFDYEHPVRRIQANHLLNIWRGERENILKVRLSLPEDRAKDLVKKHANLDCGSDQVLIQFLDLVYQHCFEDLLLPGCEADVRHQIKERVDRTTAQNLARNLRSQLMTPPLGNKKALGIRASRNTAWVALLGEDGSVIKHEALSLETDEKRAASLDAMAQLIETEKPEGIALPHGRHHEVTAGVVQQACAKAPSVKLVVVPVDEAASAIHATSTTRIWHGAATPPIRRNARTSSSPSGALPTSSVM